VSSIAQKKGFGATIWDYMTTVDHKKIAILYFISGGLFFVIGGIEAMLIRIQLMKAGNDFLSPEHIMKY
jgi:cytochrome c oxidase subunit 1